MVTAANGNLYVPRARERFTYDTDGNLTRDGRWTMAWDGENRLVAMETIPAAVTVGAPRQRLEFAYDSQSRRVRKQAFLWAGGQWTNTCDSAFVWDGWNCIAEISAGGGTTSISSYVWGLDLSGTLQGAGGVGGLLAITQAGATSLPYYDGNGNVMGLVDADSGANVAVYEYGPFGETFRTTGSRATSNPWRFSTKYADKETRTTYFGFRYYVDELGRMASRDWIKEPQSDNLYAVCNNALVSQCDYLGLMIGVYVGPSHSTGAQAFELIPEILSRTVGELLSGAIPGADPKKCKCVVWLNRLPADMQPLDSLIVWAKAHPDPASQTVLWTLAHSNSRGLTEERAESIESALARIANVPHRLYWSGSYARWGVAKSQISFTDFQDTSEESTALASGVHFLRYIGAELEREGCVKASVFTQHIAETYTRAFDIMWRSTVISIRKDSPAYRGAVTAIESLGGKTVPWER